MGAVRLPPSVTQKRHPDATTQQSLEQIASPLQDTLKWLRSLFTQTGNSVALAVDSLSAGVLSAGATKLGALTASSVASSGAVSGTALSGGTVSGTTGTFSGAVTGASYSGGPISGTTGSFTGGISQGSRTCSGPVSFAPATGTTASTQITTTAVRMPFAGSIAGIGFQASSTVIASGTFNLQVAINGTTQGAVLATTGGGSGNNQTYTPGTIPFSVGAYVTLFYSTTSLVWTTSTSTFVIWVYN